MTSIRGPETGTAVGIPAARVSESGVSGAVGVSGAAVRGVGDSGAAVAGSGIGPAHTTRVRVLRAAIELFAERGFEATTMRQLAEAADVKAPALYNHFASKETLLVEAMEWIMRSFMTAVAPEHGVESPRPPDPEAELEGLVRRHVARQISLPTRARAFHRLANGPVVSSLPPELRRQLRESRRRYVDLFTDLVALARRDHGRTGPESTSSPRIAALFITSACEQVHLWYRPEGPLSPEQVEDQVWDISRRVIGLD